jgi:hypothetical protein
MYCPGCGTGIFASCEGYLLEDCSCGESEGCERCRVDRIHTSKRCARIRKKRRIVGKHKSSIIWMARREGYPNSNVRTDGRKHLYIQHSLGPDAVQEIRIDRKTARLLAKRINQCLDETR